MPLTMKSTREFWSKNRYPLQCLLRKNTTSLSLALPVLKPVKTSVAVIGQTIVVSTQKAAAKVFHPNTSTSTCPTIIRISKKNLAMSRDAP